MRQVRLRSVDVRLPSVHPTLDLEEVDEPHRRAEIPIGHPEGVAIAYALHQLPTPRPLTHELFTEVLERFGISLELVEITALEGTTYFAQLTLVKGTSRELVACRPSDAVALGLRQRVPPPVMMAEALLGPGEGVAAASPPD